MPETGLILPDPRTDVVPVGWWASTALPTIDACDSWDGLDRCEGQLRALADVIESLGGNSLEFQKALRVVEKRRGDLLGVDAHRGGDRRSPEFQTPRMASEISDGAKTRCRLIARHWPRLYAYLLAATDLAHVTQARLLREIVRERRPSVVLPTTRTYRVIYADPPWSYSNSGIINDDNYGRVARHYPSMSIADLCALPVRQIVDRDAVLFLWVTSPLLAECFAVISAWGFAYKTSFVWDKVRHNFGHYNSVRHEFLLVCTRGSCLPDVATLIDSVVTVERSDVHSEKPEHFRAIIDQLYPRGARVELFARCEPPIPWVAWGNEPATLEARA